MTETPRPSDADLAYVDKLLRDQRCDWPHLDDERPADQPRYTDVDVAMTSGLIQLIGDGNQLAANLPGDRAEVLRDMLTDLILTRGGVEGSPEFRAGFDFARKLGEKAFRDWLKAIGWTSGSTVYPATADTTLGDVLARMANQPTAGGWIAVVDPTAEHGFRMLTFTEPSVTP